MGIHYNGRKNRLEIKPDNISFFINENGITIRIFTDRRILRININKGVNSIYEGDKFYLSPSITRYSTEWYDAGRKQAIEGEVVLDDYEYNRRNNE